MTHKFLRGPVAVAILALSAPASAQAVLFIVPNSGSLGAQDSAKKTLMEGWGFTVNPVSASAAQATIDAAAALADVAYVSEEITAADLNTKLKSATIGVINEEAVLMDDFGFSSGYTDISTNQLEFTNVGHYITSIWALGTRTITSSNQELHVVSGTLAGGLQVLAEQVGTAERFLTVIERGGSLYGGGSAAGRRVATPWGGNNFDVNTLDSDGDNIMRRAIAWAANDPNLVAHWKFDDGAGTRADDSAMAHTGTLINGPVWTTGRLSGALNFDGTADYVTTPNTSSLQITSAITIAAWIKGDSWDSGSDANLIARKGDDNPNNWQLAVVDGRPVLMLDGSDATSGTGVFAGNTTLSTGVWYHVAATWDGSTVKVYVNATQDAPSASKSGAIGTDTRAAYVGGRPGTDLFDGLIDDVRIYKRALSAAEIGDLYDMYDIFTDVSSSLGFTAQASSSGDSYGGGLHWHDYDRDGDLDAIITGDTSRLITNTSAGASFVTNSFGGGSVRKQGAPVDLDNDGDVDFWSGTVSGADTEAWFSNNGSGSFTNSGNAGFSSPTANEGAAAADVDGDGWCDVVLFSGTANWVGVHGGATPVALSQSSAAVYGFNDTGDYGGAAYCSSGDINNDGRLDFFFHYGTGKLFLSQGDSTYLESASGISVVTGDTDRFGSAFADYDNDGDIDLFTPRYDSGFSGYLWRNDSGTFTNVAATAGITDTSSQRGCAWGDYDNDGDLDLFICTTSGAAALYRNQGSGSFIATDTGAGVTGNKLDACFVDYDNDGDLDLSVTRENTTSVLLRNNTNNNKYLKVRVVGAGDGATNVAGIGVRVELYNSAGTTLLARREVGVARGFAGSEPLWVHFGGLTASTTYTVKVYFLSGTQSVSVTPQSVSTTIGSTTISQMVTVTEAAPAPVQVIQWHEVDPIQ